MDWFSNIPLPTKVHGTMVCFLGEKEHSDLGNLIHKKPSSLHGLYLVQIASIRMALNIFVSECTAQTIRRKAPHRKSILGWAGSHHCLSASATEPRLECFVLLCPYFQSVHRSRTASQCSGSRTPRKPLMKNSSLGYSSSSLQYKAC